MISRIVAVAGFLLILLLFLAALRLLNRLEKKGWGTFRLVISGLVFMVVTVVLSSVLGHIFWGPVMSTPVWPKVLEQRWEVKGLTEKEEEEEDFRWCAVFQDELREEGGTTYTTYEGATWEIVWVRKNDLTERKE